jgi:mannosyltransferase
VNLRLPAQTATTLLVAGLALVAFGLRSHHLGTQSLWYDELLQLDVVQGPFWDVWPQLERHAAMPLDYYLLFGWIRLGRQEAWVRYPALVFGTLAIPVIYTLGRRLFDRSVGTLAAILLSVGSFSVRFSQEVRPYALLTLLTSLSFLGLWQVYKTGRSIYWGLALAGLVAAALTHYFTLFLLLPMGLFVAIHQIRYWPDKATWKKTASFALGLLILLLVFTLAGRLRHLYNVGTRFSTIVSQPEALTIPASDKPNRGSGPPLERSFITDEILSPLGTTAGPASLAYNGLLLFGLLSMARRNQPHRAGILLLLTWLLLPITLIYLFLLHRGTFFAARYILYCLPAYLLLVAYGLVRLGTFLGRLIFLGPGQSNRKLSGSSLQSKVLSGGLFLLLASPLIAAELDELKTYYVDDSREDWRAAGQLISASAGPDDVVMAIKAEPAINWYYRPASVPFGTYGRSEPIWQAMQAHDRRWFVLSSYSLARDKGLRDWLAAQGAVHIPIDWRVAVYFHQAGQSRQEMLAQARTFSLPANALTYAYLAEQYLAAGDLATARTYYQQAVDLAKTGPQKSDYRTRLATLPDRQVGASEVPP